MAGGVRNVVGLQGCSVFTVMCIVKVASLFACKWPHKLPIPPHRASGNNLDVLHNNISVSTGLASFKFKHCRFKVQLPVNVGWLRLYKVNIQSYGRHSRFYGRRERSFELLLELSRNMVKLGCFTHWWPRRSSWSSLTWGWYAGPCP